MTIWKILEGADSCFVKSSLISRSKANYPLTAVLKIERHLQTLLRGQPLFYVTVFSLSAERPFRQVLHVSEY